MTGIGKSECTFARAEALYVHMGQQHELKLVCGQYLENWGLEVEVGS